MLALFYETDVIQLLNLWVRSVSQSTGKSLTEALIFVSTNPQYDDRLFIELPVQYMKTTSSEHQENMLCTQIVFCFCFDIQSNLCAQHVLPIFSPCSELGIFMYWTGNSMNNLSSYCGLVDAKIRASDIDLPVQIKEKTPSICVFQKIPNTYFPLLTITYKQICFWIRGIVFWEFFINYTNYKEFDQIFKFLCQFYK